MSDRIERAARVIAEHVGFLDDLDSDPQVVEHVTLHPVALARALDQAGALAPGPLTEECGHRDPGGHVCTCGTDDPCPGDMIVHRYVTAWEPADGIDRSEGGKAATSD